MEKIKIDIDGLDLMLCCGIIVGGFTGNWLPTIYLVLIAFIFGILKNS